MLLTKSKAITFPLILKTHTLSLSSLCWALYKTLSLYVVALFRALYKTLSLLSFKSQEEKKMSCQLSDVERSWLLRAVEEEKKKLSVRRLFICIVVFFFLVGIVTVVTTVPKSHRHHQPLPPWENYTDSLHAALRFFEAKKCKTSSKCFIFFWSPLTAKKEDQSSSFDSPVNWKSYNPYSLFLRIQVKHALCLWIKFQRLFFCIIVVFLFVRIVTAMTMVPKSHRRRRNTLAASTLLSVSLTLNGVRILWKYFYFVWFWGNCSETRIKDKPHHRLRFPPVA